jgi:LPS-assembly protein
MGLRSCPTGGGASVRSGLRAAEFGLWREPRPVQVAMAFMPLVRFARLFVCALFCAWFCAELTAPVAAETLSEHVFKTPKPGAQPEKMFVEANELVYNKDKNTVSAEGNARVYYQGRVLEADRIVYDRNAGRVYAEGHAKLTEPNGTVLHGERFDLTKDFRDGFVDSLRADTADKTFFSAPRAEITGGDTTVFEKGTYTACQACADNPEKPPLWRVRAKRIIYKNEEKMVYYQDAWLEFLGVPVAYVPVFSAPDPSVRRKSGILMPQLIDNSVLGWATGIPIFWAMAPNYDLTFTPTYFVQQGFYGDVEWRHRLANGSYYIRANGIFQEHPWDFPTPPYGAGGRVLRGSLESAGEFAISDFWKYGWEFTLLSDKWYVNDYRISNQTISSNYYSEVTSTAYLTGQGDRGYFDLRGYHFEGLSSHDFQPQQPNAVPVMDYNKTFDVDPVKTAGVGGQVEFDFNFTNLTAQAASYQAVGQQDLDQAYGLYDICPTPYKPGTQVGDCLLRGIGGEYTRATTDVSWERKYVDPVGEVWTPFAFARVNGEWLDLNTTNTYTFSSTSGSSTFSNSSQSAFVGNPNGAQGYVMPGVGVEYRYPILANTSIGSLVFEPIGQIIARPDQILGTTSLVNVDAQSLVFDDTTLFEWNKYSGYDEFETGTRANYGGEATLNFSNGGYANFIAGQSYQVAGPNGYATLDAANVGLSSGLDTPFSDYVGAFTLVPGPVLSFTAKGRFDQQTFEPRRIDLVSSVNLGAWTGSVQFADYTAQPVIGYYVRREGLGLSSKYQLDANYFVQGNITFDMSRQYYPPSLIGYSDPGPFAIAAAGAGVGYKNDCTTLSIDYSSVYQDNGTGTFVHNQTVLVQLELRTLGDAKISESTYNPGATATDGIK